MGDRESVPISRIQKPVNSKGENRDSRYLWAICTWIMVLIALFFGLRPKGLPAANDVQWAPDERAIHFRGKGIAYVDDMRLLRARRNYRDFSIEMAVETEPFQRRRFRPLLVMHDGDDRHQLVAWQWGTALIVMNGNDYDYSLKDPRVSVQNVFLPGKVSYLAITADTKGTHVYLDGKLAAENRQWRLSVPQKGEKLRVIIGNSVYGRHGWTGKLYGLAIWGRALSGRTVRRHYDQWVVGGNMGLFKSENPLLLYTFQEKVRNRIPDVSGAGLPLEIPSHIKALQKSFLFPSGHTFALGQILAVDTFINVIGFLPLGFLVYGWLRTHARMPHLNGRIVAVIFCLVLSLGIELAQAYIPGRVSSLMDVILNTLGAGLGIFLLDHVQMLRLSPIFMLFNRQ